MTSSDRTGIPTDDEAPCAIAQDRSPAGGGGRQRVRPRWLLRLGVAVILIGGSWYAWWYDPAFDRAAAAEREGDAQAAIKWALSSLTRHPGRADSARIAARQLSELLFPDEAERYYEELRRLGRFTRDDAQARALGLTRANRREQAVVAYEEILKRDPADATALQRLAALQWLRGRSVEALAAADRLARTSTGAVPGHTILAEVYHETGRRKEAIAHFRRVLELDPDLNQLTQPRVIFYAEYAADLLTEGRAAEAREVLGRAVSRDRDPGLLDLLGRACLDDGDAEEAARRWRESATVAPERVGPWVHLGKLDLKAGRPAKAAESLNRALALAPDQYEILANLATAYRLLDQPEEAREFQARAAAAKKAMPPNNGGMGADAMPRTQPRSP